MFAGTKHVCIYSYPHELKKTLEVVCPYSHNSSHNSICKNNIHNSRNSTYNSGHTHCVLIQLLVYQTISAFVYQHQRFQENTIYNSNTHNRQFNTKPSQKQYCTPTMCSHLTKTLRENPQPEQQQQQYSNINSNVSTASTTVSNTVFAQVASRLVYCVIVCLYQVPDAT